jgi:hypothetical protein
MSSYNFRCLSLKEAVFQGNENVNLEGEVTKDILTAQKTLARAPIRMFFRIS